jgi:hypothetical protein
VHQDTPCTRGDLAVVIAFLLKSKGTTGLSQEVGRPSIQKQKKMPGHRSAKKLDVQVCLDCVRSSPSLMVSMQKQVREHTRLLMKRPTNNSPFINLPSEDEVQRFDRTKKGGPTKKSFRIALTTTPASSWNKRAADIFAQDFVASGSYASNDQVLVQKLFLVHLGHLINQYKTTLKRQVNSEPTQSDLDQAEMEAQSQRRRSVSTSESSVGRSLSDYHYIKLRTRRKEACYLHPDLERFLPLWDSLDAEAMSSDEASHDRGDNRYVISKLPWRSNDATKLLRTLDHIHLSTHFSANGKRAKRGSFPHRRFTSRRVEYDATPVAGLPVNFYDKDWVEDNLDKRERRSLGFRPAIDLTLTASLIR